MELTTDNLDSIFSALEQQLALGKAAFEPVVIGGSALQALGFIERATKDVDLVAIWEDDGLRSARPIPEALGHAAERVARDFDLPADWLNAGPTDLLTFGLPEGFENRLSTRVYGPCLCVHFAGRLDQIHFKLYAMVDQGGGRHESDLRSMSPTPQELRRAAEWARTHDPSPPFNEQLSQALRILGVTNDGPRA